MSNQTILEKIRSYKELQIFIKQLEAEAHKQSIIEEMNAQNNTINYKKKVNLKKIYLQDL